MASGLRCISDMNLLFKYADNTNLLVPENTNVDLANEFSNIREWASDQHPQNYRILLHRPHPRRRSIPKSLEGIEQVQTAKLLVVIFQSTFSFFDHVDYVLKICSQRV